MDLDFIAFGKNFAMNDSWEICYFICMSLAYRVFSLLLFADVNVLTYNTNLSEVCSVHPY